MDSSTAVSAPTPMSIPVLINREYALLWTGQAISLLGDAVFTPTLVLWIATHVARGEPWAPAAVGALVFAQAVPQIILGPIAGVFADRLPKRSTMLTMDAARSLLLCLLMVASGAMSLMFRATLPRTELLGAIYATVVLVTACSQLFVPARLALIGEIVPDAFRERASGLAQTSSALSTIIGPAIAAGLFFTVGVGAALGLDALSFLVSFVCILFVPAPTTVRAEHDAGSFSREFLGGLLLVATNRVLRALLVTGVVFVLGEAALTTLSIFFLQQNLHASARLFGLLGSAQGAGALVGALLAGWIARRLGPARALWAAAMSFGVLTLILSRLTSFPPALLLIGLTGATFAVMEVAETPLLLRAAPPEYVGRVVAILLPAYSVSDTVSALTAGWLASTVLFGLHAHILGTSFGPIDTIFAGAALLTLVAGAYAMVNLRSAGSGDSDDDRAPSVERAAENPESVSMETHTTSTLRPIVSPGVERSSPGQMG